jgi:ferric-dicitrate binding protein FerR (iron transport regulator)
MSNNRLKYLLDQYISKTISPEDEQELFTLIAQGNYDDEIKEYMSGLWQMQYSELMTKQQSKRILNAVFNHKSAKVVSIQRAPKRRFIWVAASIILIVASVSLYLLVGRHTSTPSLSNNQNKQTTNDVMPGTSGAILKLDDGSSIVLDNASNGNLIHQGNTLVVKNGAGISYVNDAAKNGTQIHYNTVETPKGRQFQLILEDGTKVWLNAASSIKFPVAFIGKQRIVEITGEAYFEVAKDKLKPFQVMCNGSMVEVLGTHFNVNAYADEESMNTTLLEGSVKIVKGSNQKIIRPGEQAQVHNDGSVHTTTNINIDEVVAWKNNTFLFDNTDVKKLMRQLSRWYNVDVVFKGSTEEPLTLYGTISRTATLSTVLKMLESTGDVKLSIEGKRIIVSM